MRLDIAMTDIHSTLTRADTDPTTSRPRVVLPCWQHVLAAGVLLGLFAMTIRAALREEGASAVWATIGLWVVMGIPAILSRGDRAHGHRPSRTDKWT
jgi:hypothetical protein